VLKVRNSAAETGENSMIFLRQTTKLFLTKKYPDTRVSLTRFYIFTATLNFKK